jgi:putative ATP-dependent endonuclease of the OLD family
LFLSLTDDAVSELINLAVELHGEDLIDAHIKSASGNDFGLDEVRAEAEDGYSNDTRLVLALAARSKRAGWFKSVTWMESAARGIVGPDLPDADPEFRAIVQEIFDWASDGGD